MKTIGFIIIPIIFSLVAACNYSQKKIHEVEKTSVSENQVINDVSLIDLTANKEKYKGKKIRVIGYLNLEFEGNGLYLHKEDYDRGITKNALWLTISRDSIHPPDIKKCIKNYVILEGTFDTMEGHMGAYSGSIENITRLELADFGAPDPPTNKDTVKFSKHP